MLPLVPIVAVQAVPDPDIGVLTAIVGVSIEFYDVTGNNVRDLYRAMQLKGPIDQNDSKHVHALTTWDVDWNWGWRRDGEGNCTLNSVKVDFRATVRLPRMTSGRLSAKDRARWTRYVTRLAAHEAIHVGHGQAASRQVEAAITSASCDTASAVAKQALAAATQRDRDFDVRTDHGARDGVIL